MVDDAIIGYPLLYNTLLKVDASVVVTALFIPQPVDGSRLTLSASDEQLRAFIGSGP